MVQHIPFHVSYNFEFLMLTKFSQLSYGTAVKCMVIISGTGPANQVVCLYFVLGSSLCDLLHVTRLAPRILRWLLYI